MKKSLLIGVGIASTLAVLHSAPSAGQDGAGNPNQPPEHTAPFPNLGVGETREEVIASFEDAPHLQRGEPAREILEQRRRLDAALDALVAQRSGTVDAFVISIALDSDPVFAREAREAGRVLRERYDAAGRTLVLAGPDGESDEFPRGSIDSLLVSLARLSELMDPDEDVLVLYTTSHGLQLGLSYHYGDIGYGILSPARLKSVLEELGIERRILILSACFSGVFVSELASRDTAILTAAASERSSFGCNPENDWTFYGDAMINRALRQPQSLPDAAREAARMIAGWETERRLLASLPQSAFGAGVNDWLPALEARMPQTASTPVGRSAVGD